jgi:hypothetical protein
MNELPVLNVPLEFLLLAFQWKYEENNKSVNILKFQWSTTGNFGKNKLFQQQQQQQKHISFDNKAIGQ